MSDLRHAIRVLRASPTFTLAALAVLALGIGANSAIFALANAVLLEPLPVPEPGRLVVLGTSAPDSPNTDFGFSYPGFQDLREGVPAFAGMLAVSGLRVSVSYGGQNQRCYGEVVTGDYFTTLGVRPLLGRLLTPDDDKVLGGHPVVVLDYAFWQRLGADRGLVGRSLLLNGHPMTVVGVTGPEFYGTDLSLRPQLRVPLAMAPVLRPNPNDPTMIRRGHQWLRVMARLRPGASIEQAMAAADVVFRRGNAALLTEMPAGAPESARQRVEARRLSMRPGPQGTNRMRTSAELPLLLLGGATATLMLIACANLANLLLARGAARQREMAVRTALGGSRWRLVRQLLVESLVLSVAAGALGLLVAVWMVSVILSFLPAGNALGSDLAPDLTVVAATFALALVAGLLFGLAPALRASRHDPSAALKHDSPTVTGAERVASLRSVLIGAQVAMSFVLLVGAGLFLRTLVNLQTLDTGFDRGRVVVASVDPSLNGYDAPRSAAALTEFVQRLGQVPGIRHAGLSSVSPITGSWDVNDLTVPGYQPKEGEEVNASFAAVTPGYLEAMGIALREGRALTWRDTEGAQRVAVINETMAREYFPGGSAVGRHFSFGGENEPTEVVGVVRDGKYVTLREDRAPRFAYVPFLQRPLSGAEMVLHARTDGDPLGRVDAIRQQLRAIDATLPLSNVTTLDDQIAESLSSERMLATLGSSFGVLALLLAAVGVYGVLAFAVARRTREIGLRMALGAEPGDVSWLITRQVAVIVLAGLLGGAAGAWALQGVLRTMVFGVSPADPAVFAAAVLIVGATSAIAAWLPARRAARLDPVAALRQ